jgi:nucleotide-binding universal stress UspA family protein
MSPRRIITPVTLAQDSFEAVGVAAALAAALGAELVLAGIAPAALPEPLLDTPDIESLAQQLQEQELLDRLVTERLEEVTGTLPRRVRARSVQTTGPVGAALVAAAREQRADHVDRYVLHHSDVPVLVVPTGSRDTARANGSTG